MPFTVKFLNKNNKEYNLDPRISEDLLQHDLYTTTWKILNVHH